MINSKDEDEGQTEWQKENEPGQWLDEMYDKINGLIREYNKVATKEEENLIGAFEMTPKEYEELFNDKK